MSIGPGGYRIPTTVAEAATPRQSALGGGSASGTGGDYSGLARAGSALMLFGITTQAVGAYYQAKASQYQLKSQALSEEFEATMAAINARAAEQDAQLTLDAGRREAGRVQLQYRQVKSGQRAGYASRGIQLGEGSAAEVMATTELAKEVDTIAINSSAVRAANALRMGAQNMRNRSLLSSVSAGNLRRAAGAIAPIVPGLSTMLGGAGQVASQWAANERAFRVASRGY